MRIKVLCRNPDDYLRETKRDIHRVPRNYDPALHPFEATREYVRAVNAVKLERVFAKPFICSLDNHRDSVSRLCKHPTRLSLLLSAACDGQVCLWNLAHRQNISSVQAHDGLVQGLCSHPNGGHFFTCGSDMTIKQWRLSAEGEIGHEPMNTILGKQAYHNMDHHWRDDVFATCGDTVDIWSEERTEPIRTFKWGVDSITSVKFNPIDTDLVAGTGSDRSIILYDMRGATPLRKVVMKLRSNSLAWNPMESYVFSVANEDYNVYIFDMRRLGAPVNIHMGHVSAVMDVDYSPTGKELVSGSYDKTIRIFSTDKTTSRDVYHTKRMQRVSAVKWSLDNKYILSASDEMNIRVWKAQASDKLGVLRPREKAAFNYGDTLKEKFEHHPQVKRIARHRHIPHTILHQQKELRIIRQSQKTKLQHLREHRKPGAVPFIPERQKHVVNEET